MLTELYLHCALHIWNQLAHLLYSDASCGIRHLVSNITSTVTHWCRCMQHSCCFSPNRNSTLRLPPTSTSHRELHSRCHHVKGIIRSESTTGTSSVKAFSSVYGAATGSALAWGCIRLSNLRISSFSLSGAFWPVSDVMYACSSAYACRDNNTCSRVP